MIKNKINNLDKEDIDLYIPLSENLIIGFFFDMVHDFSESSTLTNNFEIDLQIFINIFHSVFGGKNNIWENCKYYLQGIVEYFNSKVKSTSTKKNLNFVLSPEKFIELAHPFYYNIITKQGENNGFLSFNGNDNEIYKQDKKEIKLRNDEIIEYNVSYYEITNEINIIGGGRNIPSNYFFGKVLDNNIILNDYSDYETTFTCFKNLKEAKCISNIQDNFIGCIKTLNMGSSPDFTNSLGSWYEKSNYTTIKNTKPIFVIEDALKSSKQLLSIFSMNSKFVYTKGNNDYNLVNIRSTPGLYDAAVNKLKDPYDLYDIYNENNKNILLEKIARNQLTCYNYFNKTFNLKFGNFKIQNINNQTKLKNINNDLFEQNINMSIGIVYESFNDLAQITSLIIYILKNLFDKTFDFNNFHNITNVIKEIVDNKKTINIIENIKQNDIFKNNNEINVDELFQNNMLSMIIENFIVKSNTCNKLLKNDCYNYYYSLNKNEEFTLRSKQNICKELNDIVKHILEIFENNISKNNIKIIIDKYFDNFDLRNNNKLINQIKKLKNEFYNDFNAFVSFILVKQKKNNKMMNNKNISILNELFNIKYNINIKIQDNGIDFIVTLLINFYMFIESINYNIKNTNNEINEFLFNDLNILLLKYFKKYPSNNIDSNKKYEVKNVNNNNFINININNKNNTVTNILSDFRNYIFKYDYNDKNKKKYDELIALSSKLNKRSGKLEEKLSDYLIDFFINKLNDKKTKQKSNKKSKQNIVIDDNDNTSFFINLYGILFKKTIGDFFQLKVSQFFNDNDDCWYNNNNLINKDKLPRYLLRPYIENYKNINFKNLFDYYNKIYSRPYISSPVHLLTFDGMAALIGLQQNINVCYQNLSVNELSSGSALYSISNLGNNIRNYINKSIFTNTNNSNKINTNNINNTNTNDDVNIKDKSKKISNNDDSDGEKINCKTIYDNYDNIEFNVDIFSYLRKLYIFNNINDYNIINEFYEFNNKIFNYTLSVNYYSFIKLIKQMQKKFDEKNYNLLHLNVFVRMFFDYFYYINKISLIESKFNSIFSVFIILKNKDNNELQIINEIYNNLIEKYNYLFNNNNNNVDINVNNNDTTNLGVKRRRKYNNNNNNNNVNYNIDNDNDINLINTDKINFSIFNIIDLINKIKSYFDNNFGSNIYDHKINDYIKDFYYLIINNIDIKIKKINENDEDTINLINNKKEILKKYQELENNDISNDNDNNKIITRNQNKVTLLKQEIENLYNLINESVIITRNKIIEYNTKVKNIKSDNNYNSIKDEENIKQKIEYIDNQLNYNNKLLIKKPKTIKNKLKQEIKKGEKTRKIK